MKDKVLMIHQLCTEVVTCYEGLMKNFENPDPATARQCFEDIGRMRMCHSHALVLNFECLKHARKYQKRVDCVKTYTVCLSCNQSRLNSMHQLIHCSEQNFTKAYPDFKYEEEIKETDTVKESNACSSWDKLFGNKMQGGGSSMTDDALPSSSLSEVTAPKFSISKPTLVLLLSSACHWCTKYYDEKWKSHLESIQADFPSLQVVTYWSDEDDQKSVVLSRFGIQAFPSFVLVNNGSHSIFNAGGEYPDLKNFVKAGIEEF